MNKKLNKIFLLSLFILFGFALGFQVALAEFESKCTAWGKEVPCEDAGNLFFGSILGFIGGSIILFIILIAISLFITIFWILMIVHAASNQVEGKAAWIILMIFTGLIGALIYYFVVKRLFDDKNIVSPINLK